MIGASINPTILTVGQTGVLSGHKATVVGRAVLRSGDGLRWDEYYVEFEDGRMAIVVYEVGEWKRFDAFTPTTAFSAAKAEACRVGNSVELRGKRPVVNYVSTSRVVYCEGATLEGVRVGSEARYFNAEGDGEMIVVSWTGEEVEFYTGRTLPSYTILNAFGIPRAPFWKRLIWGGDGGFDFDLKTAWQVLCMAFVIGLPVWIMIDDARNSAPSSTMPPDPVRPLPEHALPDGATGVLAGAHCTVIGHQQVEIDEVSARFRCYEYALLNDDGDRALLIQGLNGDPHTWMFFQPVSSATGLTPTRAAAVKEHMMVTVGGTSALVEHLLLTRTLNDTAPAAYAMPRGMLRYGFLAHARDGWVLARWTEESIDLEQGRTVSEQTVKNVFGSLVGQ